MNSGIRMGIRFIFIILFYPLWVHSMDIEWALPPTMISTSGTNGASPSIVIDPSGNAVIVWVENGFVLSREGTEVGGWSSSVTISGSGASTPYVNMDGQGNAIAVWIENGVVNSRNKPAGQNWSGTVSQLSSAGASSLQLAVNSNGQAVVVWVLNNTVEAVTGSFSGGWNPAAAISASNSSIPQVAIDGSGNIVAVWEQLDSSISTIYSSNQSSGGSWSAPVMISVSGENCTSPNIATNISATEKAIAIWYSYDLVGSNYSNVYAQVASLQQNGTWATPLIVSSPGVMDPHLFPTKIVMGDLGSAMAMVVTSNDGSLFSVRYTSKPNNGVWSGIETLVGPNPQTYSFALCPEKNGDVLSAWMVFDESANELIVQSAAASYQLCQLPIEGASENVSAMVNKGDLARMMWTTSITLSEGSSNGYPQLATNFSNNYVQMAACWLNFDGTNTSIQASIGGMDEPAAPTGLSVLQTTMNYGLISDTYNTLTWIASVSDDVYYYRIYRNGTYVQTVPSSQLQWIDHNQVLNQPVEYGVQAVSASLFVSEISVITWP